MQPTDATRLGQRVRSLRLARGWTQRALAARLCGVAQQSIDQLEAGRIGRPRYLPELARVFDCDLAWLLTGEPARIDRGRLAAAILATEASLRQHPCHGTVDRFAEVATRVYVRAALAATCTPDALERLADAEIEARAAADAATGLFARLRQWLWSGWTSRRDRPT